MQPLPRLDAGTGPASLWREIGTLLWSERGLVTRAIGLVTLNRAAALVMPVAAKVAIDTVIGAHRPHLIAPLGGAVLLALGIETATAARLTTLIGEGAQRTVTTLRTELYAHVIRLPVRVFDSAQAGELASRVTDDTDQVRGLAGPVVVTMGGAGIMAVAAFAIIAWAAWQLALGLGVLCVIAAALVARAYARVSAALGLVCERHAALGARLAEALVGVRTIKSRGAERWECGEFERRSRALTHAVIGSVRRMALLTAAMTVATGAAGILLLVVGAREIAAGAMTLGDLAMVAYLTGLLASPLVQAAAMSGEVGRAGAGLSRIRALRAVPNEEAEDRGASSVHRVLGAVEMEGVSYAYDAGAYVLRDVSFFAAPGSTVAIVGASGAGKSTLCALLLAFDRPTEGRILIDGRDLAALERVSYRPFVAAVLQHDVLFSGTIADAIRYGRSGVAMAEVEAAAAQAGCDAFIAELPNGYSTVVGERGVRLSGGQQQRLAIARALIGAPAILVLDEAMSNLDAESEAAVHDGLNLLRRGRTTFVIAHRLATVRTADQIIVLERGRVVERGVHEELIATRGAYWRLYERQWSEVRRRRRTHLSVSPSVPVSEDER
ncbi:MAG TPA: ABC transporter ATP-binding protein [Gemmatimonadaceae bacterium]|nr:ABC transporter ATP-binding protein [Gemmatimonadaceae bacterium]